MSKIVLAVFGSLGDLHPFIALALELRKRGHEVKFATLDYYREKLALLGFEMTAMRPNLSPDDEELAHDLMDAKKGTEKIIRQLLMPVLRETYADLLEATRDADLLIPNEVVYAAPIVAEKTNLKWISTNLAPAGMFSAHDPFVPPSMPWFENLRFLGAGFHNVLRKTVLDNLIYSWGEPVRELRKDLGLPHKNIEPILRDKYSPHLNLAMFSKVIGAPQKDWFEPTIQTGFCFYDGKQDVGKMPEALRDFLQNGDAPIVFTLGSAAVFVAGDFYEKSAKAAQILGKRAVLLIGQNAPPRNLSDNVVAFDYAPYSEVFPFASAVVHQSGIGTTSQVLRAGVPHLIMPFSHDQPDNAARCARIGVAKVISRDKYNADLAAQNLRELIENPSYKAKAMQVKSVIESENGVKTACDVIEKILMRGENEDNRQQMNTD